MPAAVLTLRFGAARLPATVHWPPVVTGSVAFLLTDEVSAADPLVTDCIVVALDGHQSTSLELAALQWLAEHAAEIGGAHNRLRLAGGARAARLAIAARDTWPALERQLLVGPRFTPERPMPTSVAGVAAATVVSGGDARDDGGRYAALLRAAGVPVAELRR